MSFLKAFVPKPNRTSIIQTRNTLICFIRTFFKERFRYVLAKNYDISPKVLKWQKMRYKNIVYFNTSN